MQLHWKKVRRYANARAGYYSRPYVTDHLPETAECNWIIILLVSLIAHFSLSLFARIKIRFSVFVPPISFSVELGIIAGFVHLRARRHSPSITGTILNYNSRHALPRYLILSFTIYRPTLASLVRSYSLSARATNRRRENTLTRSRAQLRSWEIILADVTTCVNTCCIEEIETFLCSLWEIIFSCALNNIWQTSLVDHHDAASSLHFANCQSLREKGREGERREISISL